MLILSMLFTLVQLFFFLVHSIIHYRWLLFFFVYCLLHCKMCFFFSGYCFIMLRWCCYYMWSSYDDNICWTIAKEAPTTKPKKIWKINIYCKLFSAKCWSNRQRIQRISGNVFEKHMFVCGPLFISFLFCIIFIWTCSGSFHLSTQTLINTCCSHMITIYALDAFLLR